MAEETPRPGSFVHIELPAQDVSRLKKFYADVFGWKFQDVPEMNYTLFEAPNQPHGGVYIPTETMPGGVMNYLLTESVEQTSRRIEEAGGNILMPKTEIPETGWFAIFQDTEGSTLAIYEPMPKEGE